MTASGERLIAEALAKSGVIWLRSSQGAGPVWYASLNNVAYVVTGPGEQAAPLHDGATDVITRSKETRARLLSYDATAEVLTPEDDDWDAAVAALIAGRLNAPAGDVEARWREHNTIIRLRPDTASVIVRGEAVTAHERVVEPEIPEAAPEVAAAPKVSAVDTEPKVSAIDTEPKVSAIEVAPKVSEVASAKPAEPVVAPEPKHVPDTSPTRSAPSTAAPSAVRAADTQPIPIRRRKPATAPALAAPNHLGNTSKSESPINPPEPRTTVASPRTEATQPIPVRQRRRTAQETQPIPVRAPAQAQNSAPKREITEPIPVRPRRQSGAQAEQHHRGDMAPPDDVTKVDQ